MRLQKDYYFSSCDVIKLRLHSFLLSWYLWGVILDSASSQAPGYHGQCLIVQLGRFYVFIIYLFIFVGVGLLSDFISRTNVLDAAWSSEV